MSQLKLFRTADASVAETDVDVTAFGVRSPRRVQREAVLMYLANRRSGTASTKTRAEIKGSTKKPWKQKHTGKARAGRKSSPIWRGGGIAHGPRPRDYSYNVPRSMRNISGVTVMAASDVNAYEVLSHRALLLTQASYDALCERLRETVGA